MANDQIAVDCQLRLGTTVDVSALAHLVEATRDPLGTPALVRIFRQLPNLRVGYSTRQALRFDITDTLGTLHGRGLPHVLATGTLGDDPYLAFVRPSGDLLSLRCAADRRLQPLAALRMVEDLAHALHLLRERGAPHGVPTADRVWVDDDGAAVLLGPGEWYPPESTQRLDTPHASHFWHLAPEDVRAWRARRAANEEAATEKRLVPEATAEVFLLACLFVQALSSRHPYFVNLGATTTGVENLATGTMLDIAAHGVPEAFLDDLAAALDADPQTRHRTPKEFVRALREAWDESLAVPSSATTPAPPLPDVLPLPTVESNPEAPSFGALTWLLAASTAVMITTVLVLQIRSNTEPVTLVLETTPPGQLLEEVIGHTTATLGHSPVILRDHRAGDPITVQAVSPTGLRTAPTSVNLQRAENLGSCRRVPLEIRYDEGTDTPAPPSPEAP